MAKGDKAKPVPERVEARVTVTMAGVRRGQRVLVDPAAANIAPLIEKGALVVEGKSGY